MGPQSFRGKSTGGTSERENCPTGKCFNKEKFTLRANNALVGHNSNLKSERERKRGRELFLDKYMVMGCNEA